MTVKLIDFLYSRITIVDDYNPALYLSTKGIEEAPIRYLSKSQDAAKSGSQFGFELFETPNYVLGLAAAMMNEVSPSHAIKFEESKD